MLFSSVPFLFIFLPVILLLLFPLPRAAQNVTLLVASVLFYVWGTGREVIWILFVALASWALAALASKKKILQSKPAFVVALLLVLSPLLFLKYLPAFQSWWLPEQPLLLLLPLGISFFTFHAVSYLVDVRQGRIQPERRLDHYLLYLFYFPHQIAGPIVRYGEIVDDIKSRGRSQVSDVVYGLSRFGWGLAKKQLIADPAGSVASAVWGAAGSGQIMGSPEAWLGALAFTVQIYFDFSAYSDMAVGLARIFGFHFPENFAAPYSSSSATEFWKKWHMTLSRWFRDYVYIPLGGNKHGPAREYGALLLTFALTSFWHGATIPYLVWGGMWSLLLVIERITKLRNTTRFVVVRRIWMIVFILFSWVPFRSVDMSTTITLWSSMLVGAIELPTVNVLLSLTPLTIGALIVGVIYMLGSFRRNSRTFDVLTGPAGSDFTTSRLVRLSAVGGAALIVGILMSLWSVSSPFIYFQF